MDRYFFFYGTLIQGLDCPVSRALRGALAPCGPAWLRGALFAIDDPGGWYPALLPGCDRVRGQLYRRTSRFDARALARLDLYEGYDLRRPARSAYLRRSVKVRRASGGAVRAQVYVFNARLPDDAIRLDGGDFPRWLLRTGYRPYGE